MIKGLISVLLIIAALVLLGLGCAKPLNVSITAPINGSTLNKSPIEVRGNVSDSKAKLWVNDTIATVSKKGNYLSKLELAEGENTIKVVAAKGKEGDWKEVVERTVTVTYTP